MSDKVKEYSATQLNAMPPAARPINVQPRNEKDMVTKYADRVRTGKTAKDKLKRTHGTD